MGADTAVLEYQPVVHRLRLSASPYLPTYPGRISLPQEPLGLRRRGFSPLSRYSYQHSHSTTLHDGFHRRFSAGSTLPYHSCTMTPEQVQVVQKSAASAINLSPVTLSAQDHSTSELLRTLLRMAASEPTSWLSSRSHIVFHLVNN